MGEVTSMEPREPRRVDHSGGMSGLRNRVRSLEGRMTTVEAVAQEAAANAKISADNTDEILVIIRKAKKHAPKVVVFGAGLMTATGIGNPAVWKFLAAFFAG